MVEIQGGKLKSQPELFANLWGHRKREDAAGPELELSSSRVLGAKEVLQCPGLVLQLWGQGAGLDPHSAFCVPAPLRPGPLMPAHQCV